MKGRGISDAGLASLLVFALGVTANARQAKEQTAPASVSQLEAAVTRDPGNPDAHVALGQIGRAHV